MCRRLRMTPTMNRFDIRSVRPWYFAKFVGDFVIDEYWKHFFMFSSSSIHDSVAHSKNVVGRVRRTCSVQLNVK